MERRAALKTIALGLAGAFLPRATFAQAEKVKIAYASRSTAFLTMYLAKDLGFYAREGLDAELIQMAPNLAVAALTSGEVDYIELVGSTVRAAVKGFPMRAVSVSITAPFFVLVAKPAIKSVTDLRGKIVGVTSFAGTNYHVTRLILKHYGLTAQKDVSLLAVGDEQTLYQALVTGRIDATAIAPPWPFKAQKDGFTLLVNAPDVVELPFVGLGATVSKIQRQREQVKRMIRAELSALRAIREQKEATLKVIRERFAMDADTAVRSYELILPAFSRDGQISRAGIETLIALEKEEVKLDKAIALNDVADPTLLQEVHRESGMKP